MKAVLPRERGDSASVEIGEEVWVRPAAARCTTQWNRGYVSGINSRRNVEVDGMTRHILDVRPVVHEEPPLVTDDGREDLDQIIVCQ